MALNVAQFALVYALLHGSLEYAYARIQAPKFVAMADGLLLQTATTNKPPQPRVTAYAVLGYLCYLLPTFFLIALPIYRGEVRDLGTALLRALAYGVAVYGVFNLTNLWLFPGVYSPSLALADFAYGTGSLLLLTAAMMAVMRSYAKK
jgi:uncharacterized membrane protein